MRRLFLRITELKWGLKQRIFNSMAETFTVQTDVFEGPLELLLTLIEKRKLLINDISLAGVTDDFINHIKSVEVFPIATASHFIYVASTLLLVKSRSLLPTLKLTDDEEGSIEDLERRLKLYKYFKKLARVIGGNFGKRVLYEKQFSSPLDPIFLPPKDLNSDILQSAIGDVIHSLPKLTQKEEVSVKTVISLEGVIKNLTDRIQTALNLSFREFSNVEDSDRGTVIVSFLAMLELVKGDIISVSQETHFEDIHMENRNPGIPRYEN